MDANRRKPRSSRSNYKKRKKRVCFFCSEDKEPDFKEVNVLERFITDRGKIIPRRIHGTCARHQRKITREIKTARCIALLPFNQV